MKKIFVSIALCIVLTATLLVSCGSEEKETEATASPGVLRVGIVDGGDRFASNMAGAPVGIEADIAKLAADNGGYSVQFAVTDSTDSLLAGIANGEYDLGFGRIPQTDQRLTSLTVSGVYGKGGLFLLTPRYNYMDCISIMQGGTLGISAQADPLKDEVDGIDSIVKQTYPSVDQLGKDVAQGSILAGIVSEREAVSLLNESLQAQELLNSPKEEYVAVMPQGSKLKAAVDEAISQYRLEAVSNTGE